MDQQTIDAELTHEGARELLASTAAAHLAYVAKDGTPRVVPVGFYWTGEEFVVSTATNSARLASLSERPDVSLSIDTGNTPNQARSLSVRGRAEVTIVDGLVPEYLAAARETMDAEAAAEFEKTCREMYAQQARIAIRRGGHASTTSAPGKSPSSSKTSLRGPGPEGPKGSRQPSLAIAHSRVGSVR